MGQLVAVSAVLLTVLVAVAIPLALLTRHRSFGTVAARATFATLHEASVAAEALRAGLSADSATRSVRHLRVLLDSAAVALTDTEELLGWAGAGERHAADALRTAAGPLRDARPAVVRTLTCPELSCPVRSAVVAPLLVEDRVVGTLAAYGPVASPGQVRAVAEVARWVSGQLELAERDESRTALAVAQLQALRAQISPHFVYNALTAIASFVRTDPERARELLLEFAEFTRYSSRTHGEFTTLAEELRSIDRYLLLERARFGDRLRVVLQVAPEVLPVAVPFLCLQPLVENAIKHGLENGRGSCLITIMAEDAGGDCLISVEDDGAGSDPEVIRTALAGGSESSGMRNVDGRLRAVYGEDHGLAVETARGAGTRVVLRIPKYAVGVRAT